MAECYGLKYKEVGQQMGMSTRFQSVLGRSNGAYKNLDDTYVLETHPGFATFVSPNIPRAGLR